MNIKTVIRNRIRNTKIYEYYSVLVVGCKDLRLIIASIWYHIYPIKNNKIVFSSFNDASYNGQPYEICKKMMDAGNCDIVWILPKAKSKECPYRSVQPNTIKSVYELMTAGIWIDNCRKKFWLKKRYQQLYIQTWHGPVCLKAVEKDAEQTWLNKYFNGIVLLERSR